MMRSYLYNAGKTLLLPRAFSRLLSLFLFLQKAMMNSYWVSPVPISLSSKASERYCSPGTRRPTPPQTIPHQQV